MSTPGARVNPDGASTRSFAWICASTSILLSLAGLAIHLVVGVNGVFSSYWLVDATQGVAYAIVGILIGSRRPRHVVAWLFLGIGLSHALASSAGAYATAAFEGSRSLVGARVSVWIESWVWAPGLFALATLLPLLFPDGRVPTRRFRPFVWTSLAGILLFCVGLALGAAPTDYPVAKLVDVGFGEPLASVGSLLVALSAASALVGVVVRYRRSTGTARLQLRWFVGASLLAILASMPWLPEGLSVKTQALFLPLVPIACGIAILRHRLYELNVIINRTLVYVTSSVVVLVAYLAVVTVFGRLAGRGIASNLVGTAVVALLFAPVRDRVQRMLNELLYGQRDDPYALVSRLGHDLVGLASPAAALERVTCTLSDALKLPYVAVELEIGEQPSLVTEEGERPSTTHRIPLIYGGRDIGTLVVGPRAGERVIAEQDGRVLAELAHHVAIAAYGARVTAQLQRSRRDLVSVQAEERRRIRRELHDELGPRLAGVNLQSEAAAQLIDSDPSAAGRLLEKVADEARTAVEDIRTLAYGLRPPALDELGLIAAIEERASRLGAAADGRRLRVEITAPEELPALPAAVEVAVYRIAVEALNNAARHASASSCFVAFGVDDGLELRISDDGVGLPAKFEAGVGITSMHERAEEVGGTLSVGMSPDGGALIRVSIPIDGRFAA